MDQLIGGLETIQRVSDSRWSQIQDHVLTGEQLKLKRKRLAAGSVKEFEEFVEEGVDDPDAAIAARFY